MKTPAMKGLILALILSLSLCSMALAEEETVYGRSTDPGYIGVGARPLGMGKAYVALAEDGNTIFMNPAGLGRVNDILISSMYSTLMEDVTYMVGSLTYPVGMGTLAIGYLGSAVPGIDLYSVTDYGTIEALGQADYMNYVMYLSYGMRLEGIAPDIMIGANLKAFGKQFTGPSDLLEDGNGSGLNLDLGILYQPNDWFTFGVTQINALGSGKMEYSNGIKESIPGTTKVGFSMNLMGKYGYMKAPYKLNILGDADFDAQGDRDATLHLGAELWPMEMLAIRAGVDQDPVPGGVTSNLTAGVGLRIGNISFDYAYHTYYEVPDNATSFFSISMVGPFDQRKPRQGFSSKLESPKDNVITYGDTIELKGHIVDPRPGDKVKINDKEIKMDESGKFKAKIKMKSYGAKRVVVETSDARGTKRTFKRDIFRLVSFQDVPKDHWAKNSIELLGTAGLVQGYPGGRFKPEKTLTRGELAALLVKAKKLPVSDKARGVFKDVPKNHWAAVYIEAALDAGLVKGYSDKTFRPNRRINKAEGVAIFARLEGLEEIAKDLAEEVEDSRFTDIAKNWAAGYIMAADDSDLLEYMQDSTKFNPSNGFSRAEAVEILSRTELGEQAIRNLLTSTQSKDVASSLVAK